MLNNQYIHEMTELDFSINKGFTNFGNTCFYNATLQSIFKCPNLITTIKTYTGTNQLLRYLKTTIDDYYVKENVETIGPVLLLKSYRQMNKSYIGGSQSDGEECLTYFLDNFDMATKSEGLNISNLFDCKLVSKLECPLCNYSKEDNAPEKLITLPIKDFNNFTDAFNNFLSTEILSDDNKWGCENCKEKVSAKKKLIIRSTPQYLFIALKRFEHEWIKERNAIKTSKITNNILMPDQITINDKLYNLKGSIHHMGGLNSGHYIYYHKFNDSWTVFNDEEIRANVRNVDEIINNGYIYLYELT